MRRKWKIARVYILPFVTHARDHKTDYQYWWSDQMARYQVEVTKNMPELPINVFTSRSTCNGAVRRTVHDTFCAFLERSKAYIYWAGFLVQQSVFQQTTSTPLDAKYVVFWTSGSVFSFCITTVTYQDILCTIIDSYPASIIHKSTTGLYRSVREADGPITAWYIFM